MLLDSLKSLSGIKRKGPEMHGNIMYYFGNHNVEKRKCFRKVTHEFGNLAGINGKVSVLLKIYSNVTQLFQ